MNMQIENSAYDFDPVHAAMRRYVDREILPGVAWAVLSGRELVDLGCVGWADREAGIPLRADHIFRIFSNTKLLTSCAALLLLEQGCFGLDDPIERYIPQLGQRRVLRPGATSLDDTQPAARSITIRHLLSHSSGLSYGLLDPGTVMFEAYNARGVLDARTSLAQLMDALAELPLSFEPGTSWEYSIATDVLARLVEIVSGQRFDAFLSARILEPLGMVDTAFVVPPDKRDRFPACYAGADAVDPMKPGLMRVDDWPYPGAYLRPVPRLSGGGGLVSTLPDMIALLRGLLPGGEPLLRPESIELMMTNQLADGVCLRFAGFGEVPGKVFSVAGALTTAPSSIDPPGAAGELQWGGIAGSHWWISPRANLVGVLMTQRRMSFWHPFSFEFKRLVYQAAGA